MLVILTATELDLHSFISQNGKKVCTCMMAETNRLLKTPQGRATGSPTLVCCLPFDPATCDRSYVRFMTPEDRLAYTSRFGRLVSHGKCGDTRRYSEFESIRPLRIWVGRLKEACFNPYVTGPSHPSRSSTGHRFKFNSSARPCKLLPPIDTSYYCSTSTW